MNLPPAVKPGDTVRCFCGTCLAEFEVCNEPKAKDSHDASGSFETREVEFCPFCGADDVDEA